MTHGADVLIAGVGISHAAGADQQALAVHGVHDLMDVGLHAGGSLVGLGHDAVVHQMAVDDGGAFTQAAQEHLVGQLSGLGHGGAVLTVVPVQHGQGVLAQGLEHGVGAVDVQHVEPGLVLIGVDDAQVVGLAELGVGGVGHQVVGGALSGEEEAADAGLDVGVDEVDGGLSDDLQGVVNGLGVLHDISEHLVVGQLLQGGGGAEDGLHEGGVGSAAAGQLLAHPLGGLQGLAPGAVGGGQDLHTVVVVHVHNAGSGDLYFLILVAEDVQLCAPIGHGVGAERHHLHKVEVELCVEVYHGLGQGAGVLVKLADVHPDAGGNAVNFLTGQYRFDALFFCHNDFLLNKIQWVAVGLY